MGRKTPFYVPSTHDGTCYLDLKEALATTEKLQALDTDENALVTITHDPTLGEELTKLEKGHTINDWKQSHTCRRRWSWWEDLPRMSNRACHI